MVHDELYNQRSTRCVTAACGENEVEGGEVNLNFVFLMSNYDPTHVYSVEDNIETLLVTR